MALFAYTARGHDGALIEAKYDAASPAEVAAFVRDSGATPVRIEATRESSENRPSREISLRRKRVTQEDLIFFCRQMHRLARAGVPIVRSITGLAESTRNPAFREVLVDMLEGLRSGRELSESLAFHPEVFSRLFLSIVQIGENTGQLDDAFEQMGKYLEGDRENKRRVKAALRYPMIVISAIFGALVVVNMWVIPAFAQAFDELGADLPWATKLIMTSSKWTVAYWPYGVGILGALGLAVRAFLKTPEGRLSWDRAKLKIPLVGFIEFRATLARFARGFAVTSRAGVPMLETLRIIAGALDNEFIAERVQSLGQNIEHGETLTRAAAASEVFDPLVLQMMAVGEETGMLTEMFVEIAETYESEVEYELKRLTESIEPILIVGVGGIVLLMALGIYLPMWNLAGAALG
ncbi:MAG: type II secretion system F family protein [bacterium]|nr:type II secretion system F family protein [bacterium]